MPELPEVETIKRTLEPKLTGQSFTEAEVNLATTIRTPGVEEFKKQIVGKKIKSITRRGKYLTINLSDSLALIFHLRMTGRLIYCPNEEPLLKHTHLIMRLDSGNELRFTDVRQFGRVWLVAVQKLDTVSGLKDLGPEPFDKTFTREFLKKQLRRRRTRIKPLLLDQSFVAGLGNIYADEALHRARIHPEKLSCNLDAREVSKLFHTIQEVLQEGIDNRGTTLRDYVDGDGVVGSNQDFLRIYGREGLSCLKCKTTVVKIKIGGRSSFYCPHCQKE